MALLCRRKGLGSLSLYRNLFCEKKARASHTHLTTSSLSTIAQSGFLQILRPSALESSLQAVQGASVLIFLRRNTNAAYPPPTPPEEFSGADVAEGDEAEGAELNMPDDANDMPDLNENAYNDGDEEKGEYVEEEAAPDPEVDALFSPAEED